MPKETFTLNIEYTDTFGGEANYCWVDRGLIDIPVDASERTVMRRIRKAMGLEGVRGRWSNSGDSYEFRPYGMATVCFAYVEY